MLVESDPETRGEHRKVLGFPFAKQAVFSGIATKERESEH